MGWSCKKKKKKRWKPAKAVSFFCCMEWGRGRKNKDENGNVLPEWRLWAGGRLWGWYRKTCSGMCWPAGAGRELTGCRRMFDVTVLPAGLAERQNVVFRCSPGCKPGGGVCGARSHAFLFTRCVLLPAKSGILNI